VWVKREEARRALFDYIEGFYNPRRRHSALGTGLPLAGRIRKEVARCHGGIVRETVEQPAWSRSPDLAGACR